MAYIIYLPTNFDNFEYSKLFEIQYLGKYNTEKQINLMTSTDMSLELSLFDKYFDRYFDYHLDTVGIQT